MRGKARLPDNGNEAEEIHRINAGDYIELSVISSLLAIDSREEQKVFVHGRGDGVFVAAPLSLDEAEAYANSILTSVRVGRGEITGQEAVDIINASVENLGMKVEATAG